MKAVNPIISLLPSCLNLGIKPQVNLLEVDVSAYQTADKSRKRRKTNNYNNNNNEPKTALSEHLGPDQESYFKYNFQLSEEPHQICLDRWLHDQAFTSPVGYIGHSGRTNAMINIFQFIQEHQMDDGEEGEDEGEDIHQEVIKFFQRK